MTITQEINLHRLKNKQKKVKNFKTNTIKDFIRVQYNTMCEKCHFLVNKNWPIANQVEELMANFIWNKYFSTENYSFNLNELKWGVDKKVVFFFIWLPMQKGKKGYSTGNKWQKWRNSQDNVYFIIFTSLGNTSRCCTCVWISTDGGVI